MKKALIVITVIMMHFSSLPTAWTETQSHSKISGIVGASWSLSLFGGVEWQFSQNIGVRTTLGTPVLLPLHIADESFILESEITLAYLPPPINHRFSWGISAGASHIGCVWYRDDDTEERAFEAVVSLGVNGMVGWNLKSGRTIRLWFGGGYPLFYEKGWETRDISYPLNLWPNLKVELKL